MPVYDRRYRGWEGERRSERAAILTLARYTLAGIFRSRLALVLFVLACVPPFGFGSFVYLSNNLDMLTDLGVDMKLSLVDSGMFFAFLLVQSALGFLFTALIGPVLVAPDLAHGAMPLYLSRPLDRRDYVLAKLLVLGGLLSAITWVPGLLLLGLQVALAPPGWLAEHARLAPALFLGSWLWILFLSLLALAISAWVRWRPLATAMLFIVFLVGEAFGRAVNLVLDTRWGTLVILDDLIETVWLALFGDVGTLGNVAVAGRLPIGACLAALAVAAAAAAAMLAARVRAVEVSR